MTNWTFSREELALKTLPTGHALTAPVLRLEGNGRKKCYIQANNHGGEIAGNGAIFSLLKKLSSYDIYGTIIIVPHCNPVSVNARVGDSQVGMYDLVTGQNWNRLFQLPVSRGPSEWQVDATAFAKLHRDSPPDVIHFEFRKQIGAALQRFRDRASVRGLEYRHHFALQLQQLSYDADLVLDLHTGDIAPRYLYAPESCLRSAPYFGIPHILVMSNEFGGSFDEVNFCPWMTLAEEFRKLNREFEPEVEAYTVELGSLETIRPQEMEEDADRILNFLRYQGMVSGDAIRPITPLHFCRMKDYLSYCAPASGLSVIDHPPGTRFRAGQTIGYILTMQNFRNINKPEQAQVPIRVNEDGILITRQCSPVVYEGQVLFKVMTNWATI